MVKWIFPLTLLLTSCGGTYADYLHAAITAKRAVCEVREQAIVDRKGTSKATDELELANIRLECDAAYAVLERLAKEGK